MKIPNCQETCEEPLEGGAGAGEGGAGLRVPGAQHRHQPGGVAGHRDAARTPAGQQWSHLLQIIYHYTLDVKTGSFLSHVYAPP